jgi:serine/threonine protein phosphatase PrpC
MFIYSWATSDVGRKRSHNEDAYLVAHDLRLFAVADGMGGYNAGEVASDLAIRSVDVYVHERAAVVRDGVDGADQHGDVDGAAAVLVGAVKHANAVIRHASELEPAYRGMGTTTTTLLFTERGAYVAHVGDSRCYRVRAGQIAQVSEDHSLVEQQVKAGLITREQAARSPYKNIITRSVGIEADVDVDVVCVDVNDGDAFVLCSDGLSGVVSDAEIAQIVAENFLHRVPDLLIDLANTRGGPDNITVVVCCAVAERWS